MCKKIPNEILFMPYKASMWDSLESIYYNVWRDLNYHAVVMPIPYEELEKDGTVKQTIYEGNLFPQNVEIVNCKEYSLSERQPDMIFIHNPYDKSNKVTRVCKEYYSKELIKYTKHLIYVPYYVLYGNTVSSHFCMLPGVSNSWRTIVQSEDMRKKYLRYQPQEKIIALGSPKMDGIIQQSSEKDNFPVEWSEKSRNKQVIILNTHLQYLMENPEKLFSKINNILSVFKSRKDVVLLWRPHPLTLETLNAYHKNYIENYMKMIQDCKKMSNGIYDDSPDVDRAMVFADGYIGDRVSSLVQLFGITGKPILGYDILWKQKEVWDFYVTTSNCARVIGNHVWLFSKEFNALLKIDIQTKEIEFIRTLNKCPVNQPILFTQMLVYESKLILIPCSGREVVLFDLESNSEQYVEIEKEEMQEYSPCIVKQELWLIPIYYSKFMQCINLDNQSLTKYESIYSMFETIDYELHTLPMIYGSAYYHGSIWCGSRIGPYLFSYDLETKENKIHSVNCETESFRNICFDGEYFWMIPQTGVKIVKWDPEQNIAEEYEGFFESEGSCAREEINFQNILWSGNYISILLRTEQAVICIDKSSGSYKKYTLNASNSKMEHENITGAFFGMQIENNKLYLFPYNGTEIAIIDLLHDRVDYISMKLPKSFTKESLVDYIMQNFLSLNPIVGESPIYEEYFCEIETFIDIVKKDSVLLRNQRKKYFEQFTINADGTCGEKIWNYLKSELEKERV